MGSRVSTPTVVSGHLVVMMGVEGNIAAFRVTATGEAGRGAVIRGGGGDGAGSSATPANRSPARTRPGL